MINAYFDGAYNSVTSQAAYLHDYGQTLRVLGLNLPSVVEAHFAAEESGTSVLVMGTCTDGIANIQIPDVFLSEVGSFFCYIYDRTASSGKTVYKIKIPVTQRPDLPNETVNPSEQDVSYFEQVLAQMTSQTDRILNGLSIGTVETREAGENATASITAEGDTLSLNLGIPQGAKGEDGEGGGVGESTAGQTVTYNGTDYTCSEGAERFNNYSNNLAVGKNSHAEGDGTKAIGNYSHAEGGGNEASGIGAHAEGLGSKATGISAHAEGGGCQATSLQAHAEGSGTTASGANSHAEGGGTTANGMSSHAEGGSTYANAENQHVQGRYNVVDNSNKYADIVGNGTSDNNRSNAETTDWTGIKWLKTDVRCGGSDQDDYTNAISMVALANKLANLEARVAALEGGNG